VAFARSDLEEIDRLCADDIVLWGTDDGEAWQGKEDVLREFADAYDLGVDWIGEPAGDATWVAGHAGFRLGDGSTQRARVTMVFRHGLCVHAHYSVAVT
jgi:hypothetical protein